MTDATNIRDVVVIGRGFAGLTLALELAKSGACSVDIIYDENDALEASSAAHGISTMKGIFEAESKLFSQKIDGHRGFNHWLQQLESLLGMKRPANVWRLGVYESFRTEEDFRKDFGRIYRRDFFGAKNVIVDFAAEDQFARAFYPADFWVDPRYVLRLLIETCARLGVQMRPGRVLKVQPRDGYSELVLKSASTVMARRTVICTGAGTPALIPKGCPDAVSRLFGVAGSTFKATNDQNESCEVKGTSGVVSFGENIYWGSTSELAYDLTDGALKGPPNHHDQIGAAQKLLSKLGRHKLKPKSINADWGVRVRTRKRDPFVECVEPRANIWVSTGFYKSGITLCWLFSRGVANKILESVTVAERQATSSR